MSQSRIVPFFKETNEGFPFLGTLSLPTTKKPSKIKLSPLPPVVVHKIEYPTFTNSKHTQEWETFSSFKNRYKVLSDSWNIKQNYSRTKHYNVTPIWNFLQIVGVAGLGSCIYPFLFFVHFVWKIQYVYLSASKVKMRFFKIRESLH